MANTVLGKVSCVPKGDYRASTTYYALDIVGYNGGSYLAMKEITGVTPSNDQVNWMQLSGPGLPGVDGVTFTPSVSEAGVISWTNDGGEDNPDPVNIMGPAGAAAGFGTVTATADNTSSETPSVDVQSSGPDTAKNFTFAFTGLKGKPGETPDIEIGTVNTLEPGQDATADITGTTPNLTLSLGIPKGQPGTSVSRIQRTSGTGAAGTTDTYTMYDSNDDAIGTFTVYNGANGAGAGDMMADGSVPMTGPLNMGGNRVTNVGAPTAGTDAVRQSDLQAVSDEVDHILDGTTPVAIPAATEAKVGGIKPGTGLEVEADGTANVTLTGVPDGGTTGQILTQGASGPEWEDAPDTGVTKFNGRTGEVEPQEGDYTASMVGARPDTWTPSASDVGAIPASQKGAASGVATLDSNGKLAGSQKPTYTASEVGAIASPSGGSMGQVLTKTASGTAWDDVPSDLPAGGTDGQVLTKTADGVAWEDAASGLPDGGTAGQMLYQGANGPEWGDKPVMYVNITGTDGNYQADKTAQEIYEACQSGYAVFAVAGDNINQVLINLYSVAHPGGAYFATFLSTWMNKTVSASVSNNGDGSGETVSYGTSNLNADDVSFTPTSTITSDNVQDAIEEVQGNIPTDYVPTSRTVNGQALSQNITLDAEDVGAMPPPTRLTATLSASRWSGNRQTITVNGVITNTSAQDIDISCADKASADAWAAGGVWCSNPTQANKLTFTCTTPPTATINLNIRLWEVGG